MLEDFHSKCKLASTVAILRKPDTWGPNWHRHWLYFAPDASLRANLCCHPSIHSCIGPSIHACSRPFIDPCIHLSIHPSIHPFICPSIHPCMHPCIRRLHNQGRCGSKALGLGSHVCYGWRVGFVKSKSHCNRIRGDRNRGGQQVTLPYPTLPYLTLPYLTLPYSHTFKILVPSSSGTRRQTRTRGSKGERRSY